MGQDEIHNISLQLAYEA